MITISARLAVGIFIWGAALFGVLQINRLDIPGSHWICGAWGCGPPLSALIACHGFWLVLMAPALLGMFKFAPELHTRLAGWTLLVVGVGAIVAVFGWQAAVWLPNASPKQSAYFFQRCMFMVVIFVEAPIVQFALMGVLMILDAYRKRKKQP